MRICLISPPTFNTPKEDAKEYPDVRHIQHMGLGYIASMLETKGFAVDVLECASAGISLDEVYRILESNHYEMIGISTYFYNLVFAVKIARRVKKLFPHTFLFIGGYYPTLCTEEAFSLFPHLDCCVIGEGEYTCLELAEVLVAGDDFRRVAGIAYKEGDTIVSTPVRPLIANLDELPFPKITYLSKYKIVPMISSRGCYGNCTYCASMNYSRKFVGEKVRRRSIANTVAEMISLLKSHGVGYFSFQDDIFFENTLEGRVRIHEFCKLLKENNLKIKFMISARANDVEPCKDLLLELMEVGLDYVFVGAESFVARQLKSYSKQVTVEENISAVKTLNEIGLVFTLGLILYEPFTTIDEVLTNIRILREIKYDESPYCHGALISQKGALVAFYGCPFHQLLENKGLLTSSELGYRFVDTNVNILYQAKNLWAKKIESTSNLLWNLVNLAMFYGEVQLAQELLNEKAKLVRLDLDFMEQLCFDIQHGKDVLTHFEERIAPWMQEISESHDRLEKFRSQLSNLA